MELKAPCHCCGVAVYVWMESCFCSKLLTISSSSNFKITTKPPAQFWWIRTPMKCSFLIWAKQTCYWCQCKRQICSKYCFQLFCFSQRLLIRTTRMVRNLRGQSLPDRDAVHMGHIKVFHLPTVISIPLRSKKWAAIVLRNFVMNF